MEQMGLLDLPAEVVVDISVYLSVEDVLACCLVCRRLRAFLDDNPVWRWRLPSRRNLSRLSLLEQIVSSPLPPLLDDWCDQRALFARKTRLIKNWRCSNFVEYGMKSYGILYDWTIGTGPLFYKDKFLFVSCYMNDLESYAITIWDVGRQLGLHTMIHMFDRDSNTNRNISSFFIVDTKLVVVECANKVVVYEIILPEKDFPLLYSFIINGQYAAPCRRVDHPGPCDCRCLGWSHFADDQYLFSIQYSAEMPVLEVWDISDASKVGSFPSPLELCRIKTLCQTDNWLLMESDVNLHYNLFYFDIRKRKFSDNIFCHKGSVKSSMLFKNCVIIFTSEYCNLEGYYDTLCTVYDFASGEKLRSRRFSNPNQNHILGSVSIVDGTFVTLCSGAFLVVNALTLEIVDHFPCDDLCYIKQHLDVFGSVFALACTNKNDTMEMWDIKNKKQISMNWKFDCESHLFINDVCNLLVYFDRFDISVLHFW